MAVDEEAVENIINNKLPPLLDYLESEVPAGGFLFGGPKFVAFKPTRKSAQRGSATARGGSKHA